MKQRLTLAFILLLAFFNFNTQAQETRFFMPKEIKKAYENETRSYDGNPGPNYWQNFVDYKIKVEIVPGDKLIKGEEKVVYKNESPDKLNTLVVRLYANVYKKGNGRAYRVDHRDLHDGVKLLDFKINGEAIDTTDKRAIQYRGTNVYIRLPKPLDSAKELTFETKWEQKLQYSKDRTGIYDSTTFFIAYWYPQIAVYDDLFGWDRLDYNLTAEFYNNLGKYDVEITAPQKYMVWATGTFENAEEVLPKEIYKKYEKAKESTKEISIIGKEELKDFKVLHNKWHYTANEVSDFAFAVSDHSYWNAAMQVVGDRKVLINSVFPDEKAKDCMKMTEEQQKTMEYFSNGVPGVPYPYEAFTSFVTPGRGGGGMEYPMMANNGGAWRGLTVHEMFHTYFPMYVRTNEKRWAWMDEGWADYTTSVIEGWYFEEQKDIEKLFSQTNGSMQYMHGTVSDLPLMTTSNILDDNYGYASYPLPSCIYTILHQHLGNELFFKCYKEYITRWAKKSPSPYDFFYTFENVSMQDLSWLWKPWFFEFGEADLEIVAVKNGKLTVKKVGSKPVPIFVTVTYNDADPELITKTASVWDKNKSIEIKIPNFEKVKSIVVNKSIVDVTPSNNFYPTLKEITAKSKVSEKILGEYTTTQFGATIKIIKEDGLFYFNIVDYRIKELIYPEKENEFFSIDGSKKIEFDLNETGCKGFKMDWGGWKFEAKKK